jgi:hypothetical protein
LRQNRRNQRRNPPGNDPIIRTRAFAVAAADLVALAYIYVWGLLPHNVVTEESWRKLLEVL